MRRIAVLVLVVAMGVPAFAEDDDALLETPPADGIPERVEALEREWAEDVGVAEPTDEDPPEREPLDEAHEAARGAEPDADDPPDARRATVPADEPPTRKAPIPLESPLQRTPPDRPVARGTQPPASREGAAVPAKRPTAEAEE